MRGRAAAVEKRGEAPVSVGHAHDPAEQEAERVADALTRPAALAIGCTACAAGDHPCPACAAAETGVLRRLGGEGGGATAPPVVGQALATPGRALPAATLAKFERRLGRDLGHVRLHDGPLAAAAAHAVQAQAFALGPHIVLGAAAPALDGTTGQRLLAHEVAHTLDGDHTVLRRQPPGAAGRTAPPAGGGPAVEGAPAAEVEPTVRSGTESLTHRGVTLYFDRAQVRYVIRRMVAQQGLSRTRDFVDGLTRVAHGPAGSPIGHLRVGGPPRVRSPADEMALMRRGHPAVFAMDTMHELRAAQNAFRSAAGETLRTMLDESERGTREEGIRLGLTQTAPTAPGGSPMHSLSDTAHTAGAAAAARDLVAANQRVRQLQQEQSSHVRSVVRPMGGGYDVVDEITNWPEYMRLAGEITAAQREYETLFAATSLRYPIIAAAGEARGGMAAVRRLEALGGGAGSSPASEVVAELIAERLSNVARVRRELAANRVRPLKLEPVVAVTKRVQRTVPGSADERAVDDMISDEAMDDTLRGLALAVVAIGLGLLASIPTGGSSLIAAGAAVAAVGSAALSIHLLSESIREYQLESAAARTDLDRARAVGASDPSLFWVALDVVGVIVDVGAAARAFRALARPTRAALAARGATELEETTRVLQATADGHAPGLGTRLTERLARLRGRGNLAERAIGTAGPEEIRATAQLTREAEAAARGAGGAVRHGAAHGGQLTVTRRGQLFTCASPCVLLREKYAAELASRRGMLGELTRLEAEAVAAAGDSARMINVAERAAALEGRLRLVPAAAWRSPLAGAAEHGTLLRRRGSAAFQLDRKPPGWTGADEATFRYGRGAAAESGYRWVLDQDGALRYVRMNAGFPERVFDPVTGAFRAAGPRPAAVALETEAELARLAAIGAEATSRADWLARLRRGVPGIAGLDDTSLVRVMAKSPNLDHMRGELVEALAAGPLSRRAAAAGRGAEFVPGHRVTDAAGRQLTDGMVIRRTGPGQADVLVIGESKAGASSAEGLRVERTRIQDMSPSELRGLEAEAIEAIRDRVGHGDTPSNLLPRELTSESLRRTRRAELDALMRDLNTREAGQVVRDVERMMPNVGETYTTILVDGAPLQVRVSRRQTLVAASVPTDVRLQSTIAEAAEQGIRVEAAGIGLSSDQLHNIARQLRAEQMRNGGRFP